MYCFVKHELKGMLKYMGRKLGPTHLALTDREGQILLVLGNIADVANHYSLVDTSYT